MKKMKLNYILGAVFVLLTVFNTQAHKKKGENTSSIETFRLSDQPDEGGGLIYQGIKADPPSAPTILNQDCNSATLQKDYAPIGITWYWQGTNSAGTSTSNSNNTYVVTASGRYYLRARNNSSGLWSTSSSYVDVTLVGGTTWYADTDGDSFGNPNNTTSACTQPSGYVSNSSDYDDSTVNITNIAPQMFYLDADGDGFGDPNNSVYYSVKPAGYVTNNIDDCPNEAGANNGCSNPALVFSDENYVFTRVYQTEMTSSSAITKREDVQESITYYDGLGRAKQSIAIQAGGVLTSTEVPKDIVTHIEYDALGRQAKEYLPYATATSNGGIITGDIATAAKSYYKTKYSDDFAGITDVNQVNAYSEKEFDGSPLNKVMQQAAPGEAWKLGNGHEIRFDYQTNISGEVRIFGVTTSFANNTYTPTLTGGTSDYPAGELYKTITKDENWTSGLNHTTEEFKNKQGQVILKRTYNSNQPHDTYYVYDDFGNLTYVLPPKVEADTDKPTIAELDELCYQYKYDYRNRLVEKKIPGKGWEYIVYDKLDRPVLTQDANLRSVNNNSTIDDKKWLFTKYDALGRVVYTGIYTHSSVFTQAQMQSHFDSVNNSAQKYYEEKKTTTESLGIYYTNNNFPNTSLEVLTVNYYDNYTFDRAGANTSVSNTYGINSTDRLQSLATGSKVKVLGTSNWITTVTYYDKKARPIYVYSKNEELQTTDIVESNLDFSGKVLETKTTHKKSGKADIVIVDTFSYDHVGRLTKQTQTIGSHTETIVANEYDELGQLKTKKVGGTLQEVDYAYNVRSWLKNINQDGKTDNDLFNFSINYNKPQNGATPLFNGNISETSWSTLSVNNTSNPVSTNYRYQYDALNRITAAISDVGGNYNLSGITYDKNGNIETLNRNGWQNTTTFTDMDVLSYDYGNTNQLNYVTDSGNNNYGFIDGNKSGNDFEYDSNGNMIKDANKGITNITYNHLNLPVNVTLAGGTINYTYDAAGNKLRKTANSTTTEYAGNYIYENNTLQFFNHPEGYVKNDGGTFNYVYQYKDHLGNVRLSYTDNNNDGVITASTEIIEESNYYPFGLKHKGYNGNVSPLANSLAQKWGYNGKELNDDLIGGNNLNWHDFGARNYDAALGRWMNLDPHADNYMSLSPYNSFANNPLSFIDPDGKDILFWQKNEKGKWEQVEYSKLSKDVQKALSAFANTKEGYNLLKDFAKKGDKVGDVEFGEDGKYSKHEFSIKEHSRYGDSQASAKAKKDLKNNKMILEMTINTIYRNDYKTDAVTAYSVNIGHEAFVHFTQYIYKLIDAYDKGDMAEVSRIFRNRKKMTGAKSPEHSGYLNNKAEFKRMKTYLSQLRQVLNPKEVNKAINEDKDNLKLYGN